VTRVTLLRRAPAAAGPSKAEARMLHFASEALQHRCSRGGGFHMRSPIALEHQAASHKQAVLQDTLASTRRVDVLAERIAMHIESLVPRGRARCLDIGGEPALIEAIHEALPRSDWRCIDERETAAAARRYDGRTVPFKEREFDIALLCDVLNRAPDQGAELLLAAGRLARRVLVKDHFEYGSYSRALLRLKDLVDDWSEGVSVPHRYFTREAFTCLAAEHGFVITALDCGLSLNEQMPLARTLVRPDSDFIAVLRRVE
jgi:hypothetical protein